MKERTFNDGVVKIYRVTDEAAAGELPKEKLELKETLRYERRIVGFKRYYAALQANQQIEGIIRCPYRDTVSAQDIAEKEGKQYQITLIQIPEDIYPPVMDLTLSRLEQNYES